MNTAEDTARQVTVILGARSTELGRRAIRVEVFSQQTGKRLADLVQTTHGLVAVTYTVEADRVTGEQAAIVALTEDDSEQTITLAEGAAVTADQLRAAARAGRQAKIVLYADPDALAHRWMFGYSPGANTLVKAAARRAKLRALLTVKKQRGFPRASIEDTERLLAEAEADYRREVHRRRRRGDGPST